MTQVLITAFDAYDGWSTNASWLALVELTRDLPIAPQVTTRLYPVDFQQARQRLEQDLAANFDVALHLGQAPGCTSIRLEAIGINVGGSQDERPDEFRPLVDDGPIAYRSRLPLNQWTRQLRDEQIPARVSYHAGTFLCNALLYLTHYLAERRGLKTGAAFVHLPLSPSQTSASRDELPSLPSETAARALRVILNSLADEPARNPKPDA